MISTIQEGFRMWKRQGTGFLPTASRKKCSYDNIYIKFFCELMFFIFHEYSPSGMRCRSYDNSVYHLENLSDCFPKWMIQFTFIYIIHIFMIYTFICQQCVRSPISLQRQEYLLLFDFLL